MARLKTLLFRQEIKNRRVSKIKSKLYHKLKKKDTEREAQKLEQYMMEVDPEAAKAYKDKVELKQVEERLRIRHGTESKFAKNLKRFRGMDDQETRDAYHQTVLDRQELTKRTKKIASDSESDGSSVSDSDEEGSVRGKAVKRLHQEAFSDDSLQEEASDSDEDVIKMNFEPPQVKQKVGTSETGITALKFM